MVPVTKVQPLPSWTPPPQGDSTCWPEKVPTFLCSGPPTGTLLLGLGAASAPVTERRATAAAVFILIEGLG